MELFIARPVASIWLVLLGVCTHVSRVSAEEGKLICSGVFWCADPVPSDPTLVTATYFHYDPSSGLCSQLRQDEAGCVPAANCSFTSVDECYRVCGEGKKSGDGCRATEHGCCGDGVTVREGEGRCPGESEAANARTSGGKNGVHWGLISSGVCGAVLLLTLVAIVGLATYTYRQRHKNRQRWYIHEVLQMYEGGESSDSGAASDSSWDDPEHKNMFDHL